MENSRHKCKLCFRTFVNGKALGGHMKAHLATLPVAPMVQAADVAEPPASPKETALSTSSSSGEEEEDDDDDGGGGGGGDGGGGTEDKAALMSTIYGLRENPRRSFRFADPEFSFSGESGFVVQDRESETESRNPTTRRRSKRRRRLLCTGDRASADNEKPKAKVKAKPREPSWGESAAEAEPVSSVSDTWPEEDVAMCLMMLSRDKWRSCGADRLGGGGQSGKFKGKQQQQQHYECETCKKVFRSSQALGGHRVIHRKKKSLSVGVEDAQREEEEEEEVSGREERMKEKGREREKKYECPYCGRVFGNGQALGGHKRSHLMGSTTTAAPPPRPSPSAQAQGQGAKIVADKCSFLDLNMPAPMEEDDLSVVLSEDGE